MVWHKVIVRGPSLFPDEGIPRSKEGLGEEGGGRERTGGGEHVTG